MGCSSPQNAGVPNIPSQHYQRLSQVSQIGHPLNVNKKYEHISRINQSVQVGRDFKRTFAYDSLVTKEELVNKRKQFWDTRINGSPQCWNAIRSAIVEPNQNQGKAILKQMKIHMLNNSIQMCIDSRLNKYEVPVFCINQPLSLSQVSQDNKGIVLTYEQKQLQVKIRSTRFPNQDIAIKSMASTEIATIKETIKNMKDLPTDTNIRLFYGGREVVDDKTLGNYNFNSGVIIQAMIR